MLNATLLMAASLMVGQTEPATAPQKTPLIEFGNLLVGEWVGEASLLEHAPADGKNRDKIPAKLTYRWILGGKALEGEWRRGDVSGKWLVMWDPATESIRESGARSDGNVWQGVIIKRENSWVEETEGKLSDGSKITSRFVTVSPDDGDTLVWEGAFSIDGKKQDPVRDVYEKVNKDSSTSLGDAPKSIPTNVLKELQFMVGKWNETPKGEGGPEKVLLHERAWSPGKHCLIVTWSGVFDGVKVDASGIVGWSSTTNQVTEHWYLSDGTYFETCYPVDKMKQGVWEGTTSWVDAGGQTVSGTCQLKKGKNRYIWTANIKDGDVVKTYESTTIRIDE